MFHFTVPKTVGRDSYLRRFYYLTYVELSVKKYTSGTEVSDQIIYFFSQYLIILATPCEVHNRYNLPNIEVNVLFIAKTDTPPVIG